MARDLTATAVRNAKALPAKTDPNGPLVRTEIPDGKSRGLFLVVQPSGAKSWALRFTNSKIFSHFTAFNYINANSFKSFAEVN